MGSIPISGLMSRNPIAYKWKSLFRCWLVREATFWRITDLLAQSYQLHNQGYGLGARILLRSGLEALAVLIHLNHKMKAVSKGELNFQEFGDVTSRLALGSKRYKLEIEAVNVLTMIDKGDTEYPGLREIYDRLSESAHPNYEGLLRGYTKIDHDEYEVNFSNRWIEIYGLDYLNELNLCMEIYYNEYDQTWSALMEKLEQWVVENDKSLEQNSEDFE